MASAEVASVATEPEMVAVPSTAAPSLKMTMPDGDDAPAKVAVRVTIWPAAGALDELDMESEGEAFPTMTVTAPDVAAALLLSPA